LPVSKVTLRGVTFESRSVFRTAELARIAGVHPNTVRFYEDVGFLPPVFRQPNGYRVFTQAHLQQLLLIRTALKSEILHNDLRKAAIEIIRLSAASQFEAAFIKCKTYTQLIEKEIQACQEAIQLVHAFLADQQMDVFLELTRNQVAELLGLSVDVLRNWELNGLIEVPRKANGYRIYTEKEISELKIIRTLRSAGFSLMSILRLMNQLRSQGNIDVETTLDTPGDNEDIVSVADRLLTSLNIALQSSLQLTSQLEDLRMQASD